MLAVLLGAFLNVSVRAKAAEMQLWMSVSPPNPIVGKIVTVSITSSGGDNPHQYVWNSSNPTETPQLYNWTAPYPYATTKTMSFVYTTTGGKSITVAAASGNQQIVRTLYFNVVGGKMSPNGGDIWVSASPPNPIVGETVTVSVTSSSGGTKSTKTATFIYNAAGTKFVNVTSPSGISRTLSFDVVEGRITLITPNGGEVWEVGKTYQIQWITEGNVPFVQIGLWDDRYNSEVGSNGEELIAFSTTNTGWFNYEVPPARADGISAGNLGGQNYKVSVQGFNPCFGGLSAGKFTIKLPVLQF